MMDHQTIKSIIYDRHEVIKNTAIVPRNYSFETNANYVLTGLRRCGKTTQLYQIARNLVEGGADWNRIIFINFEDERFSDFTLEDFNDIVLVQSELSDEKGYFFFDEIQNIEGWEKFVRRLADSGERVYITGSNAKMLSSDIEAKLGGRYMTKHINPYSFDEYLTALGIAFDERALLTAKSLGRIKNAFAEYFRFGAFPEIIGFRDKRSYVENIFQKIQLGDVIARNNIRNVPAMRILIKKIAETVRSDVSYTRLCGAVTAVGVKISKDIIINYVSYIEDAYLIFRLRNFVYKFAERESSPKYYFSDNGILNLFLFEKDSSLLENLVAVKLHQKYKDHVYFYKSSRTGIDIDFYLPEKKCAIQAAYSLNSDNFEREVSSLVSLAKHNEEIERFRIITYEEEKILNVSGIDIEVVPAYKFLLED